MAAFEYGYARLQYIYIYIYIYMYTYAYIHVYTHFIYVHTYIYIEVYLHICKKPKLLPISFSGLVEVSDTITILGVRDRDIVNY